MYALVGYRVKPHNPVPELIAMKGKLKKPFVKPTLNEEASLTDRTLSLISGGGVPEDPPVF